MVYFLQERSNKHAEVSCPELKEHSLVQCLQVVFFLFFFTYQTSSKRNGMHTNNNPKISN